jgi:hypothetical protein
LRLYSSTIHCIIVASQIIPWASTVKLYSSKVSAKMLLQYISIQPFIILWFASLKP